ncbi:MAG: polymer-forming cytoskeletal protein [Kiritimatiellae bacterium]|nr:polymer-forming cytoskeletal protein [Kiritimatiellia bacterium]
MAESRKAKFVDGYTAVRAAAHASKRERKPPAKSADQPGQKPEHKTAAGAQHYGRTALPTKHEIVCYECDYVFHLTGRAQSTFCPKCRAVLDLIDYTIEDEWTETLKTAGKITLAVKGVLKSGELYANDIVICGTVEAGTVHAVRRLEIGPGAVFPEDNVTARDVTVAPGAAVTLKQKAHFRNVEVAGELKAKIYASGVVSVRPGGCLQGEVHSEHLVVDDGGGLKAKMFIEPAAEKAEAAGEEPLRKTA